MGRKVSQKAKRNALRVKNITREEALSYNRTIPNGIGVTAISAVNGRGAYSEFQQNRYEQTLAVLGGGSGVSKNKDGSMRRRASGFRYRPVMPNRAGTVRLPSAAMVRARQASSARTPSLAELAARAHAQGAARAASGAASLGRAEEGLARIRAQAAFDAEGKTKPWKRRGRAAGKTRKYVGQTRVFGGTVKMPKEPRAKKSSARKATSKKVSVKAASVRKVSSKKASVRKVQRPRTFRPLMARAGGRKFNTFLYHPGGEGKARKMPDWYIGGASSARDFTEGQRARLKARRAAAAKKIAKRIRSGSYPFTPNAGFEKTVPFTQWAADMKKTSKRKSKSKSKKKSRKLHGAALASHQKKVAAKRRSKKAPSKKAASKRVKRAASKRVKRAASKRASVAKAVSKAVTKALKKATVKKAKRSYKKPGKTRKKYLASLKRLRARHGYKRNGGVTSYISNLGIGTTAEQLVAVVKEGAVIAGGLAAHKVLTNLVVENVGFFKDMPYGKSVAALAVAAVGVPVSTKFVAGMGSQLAIGMGASLVHTVLVEVLSKMGQSQAASYLGDYTEASQRLPAASYGSYYEFSPGQTYAGMGEYIETGTSGFGDYMQAAAGMGGVMQAAAGFGSPGLMQAAAGVGEYIVTGAQGIGEYEQVAPEYTAPAALSEGIHPSLSAAEQALTIAEAAAGVNGMGNVDASLQQIVYPRGQALDIDDQPGGSRAGVFVGGNGVFGP